MASEAEVKPRGIREMSLKGNKVLELPRPQKIETNGTGAVHFFVSASFAMYFHNGQCLFAAAASAQANEIGSVAFTPYLSNFSVPSTSYNVESICY